MGRWCTSRYCFFVAGRVPGRRIGNRERENAHILSSYHQSILTGREAFAWTQEPTSIFRLCCFCRNLIRLLGLPNLGTQDR